MHTDFFKKNTKAAKQKSRRQLFPNALVSQATQRMNLSLMEIKTAKSDEDLFEMLSSELQFRLPESIHADLDVLTNALRRLPRGWRAMAATYRLDVSMAINDLAWHFYNNLHQGFCDETTSGLLELEAIEAAEVFQQARMLIEPHWAKMRQLKASPTLFADWHESSGLEISIKPLNSRLWKICSQSPDYGLMQYWLTYARKYPDRLVETA